MEMSNDSDGNDVNDKDVKVLLRNGDSDNNDNDNTD